nr:retrotransposon protein, putative, Ty1-copia subclass [Tanacetum cinerariifolium]
MNTSTNAWNATNNTVARIVPIWKHTGRRFNLHDIFRLRTSTKPIVKPSELTPCVSPSTNATLSLEPILEPVELCPSVSSCASLTITMVSRFSNYKLNDRKANNGTEFVNQTLRDYYEEVGISHETSVARSPQQNGVVGRRNCTLIEAATMLIY